MKKKTIVLSAVATSLALSLGCATAFAAESDAYSYHTGQQNSANRNELYEKAQEFPENEQEAFLAENGIGETPWSEEAAASYSYVLGQQRGASYRQGGDADSTQDNVSLTAVGGSARFEVTDYGKGITDEELPYIWDRYYTARNRKNKTVVSGLGLSIAKEILTTHGAKFGVDNRNKCAFWFELQIC